MTISRRLMRLREGRLELEEKDTEKKQEKNLSREKFIRSIGLVSELGFVISVPMVGGVLLGIWLDDKFSSSPKLTLSMLFLGVVTGFINLIVVITEFSKKKK